jgi:O-antigen ligase
VSFAIISCLYPLGWYVTHLTEAQLRYASGKTLPTFMQDHVRYGLFLSSGLLILLYEKLFAPKLQIVLSIFLAFCLVILSVRTAWVALLILAIIWISSKSRRFVLPLGIAALLLICLAAYQFLPTVQQKINYIRWDWESYKVNNYQPDFSDGTRRVINQISWELIYQKKQSNLGWSRVAPTLQTEITNRFPAATVTYGWPFNQYLFWWMGAGIIGLLLFSSWLLSPVIFFFNNKPVFSWTLVFAASCLVESTLNLQYGVFLHAWLMALFALSKKAE